MRERSGGCLCGAVRYVVRGAPAHVGCCHCGDCRKRSGSAFAIYGHWPSGACTRTGDLTTFDGDAFCGRCGSRLGLFDEAQVEINLGTLDEAPFGLLPEAELWVKRREPWIPAVEGAAQHEESRAR
jgi:hypothetical protein